MRRAAAVLAPVVTVGLGGCGIEGPPLAGFADGQWAVVRAMTGPQRPR